MISLRGYIKDVEKLVEHNQNDEAIAHCKNILGSYPKYIDAYRLLGQALLENKKYDEARDIFDRVLSVYPDDFISHVGLSIIYEDLRYLDLAILNMEAAFDVQPSNVAIQEELKRLFGRRDGAVPQKIRLSKGALIRMYAKGELFQQAISEIRSTLEESPKRTDLEVILAKMYFQSGLLVEAAETCNSILENYPQCFEANRILFDIFNKNGNVDNAKRIHDRLESIDPYFIFTSTSSANDVPDGKINIEKLASPPALLPDADIPEWTTQTNMKWSPDQNSNPDFLSGLLKDNDETLPSESQADQSEKPGDLSFEPTVNSTNGDDLPDWMQIAGWLPSSGAAEESNSIFQENFEEASPIPVPSEQFPEWLKEIAPQAALDGSPEDFSPITPPSSVTISGEPDQEFVFDRSPEIDNLRQSLSSWDHEAKMENETFENDQNDRPDDLGSNSPSDSGGEPEESNAKPGDNQDLPEWLRNFEQDQAIEENTESEIPDWMKNLQSQVMTEPAVDSSEEDMVVKESSDSESGLDSDFPDVLSRLNDVSDFDTQPSAFETFKTEDQPEPTSESPAVQSDEVSSPFAEDMAEQTPAEKYANWQKEQAADAFSPEEIEKISEPEPVQEQSIPLWVKSLIGKKEPASEESVSIPQSLNATESQESMEVDAVKKFPGEGPVENAEIADQGLISEETNEELLDWLKGFKTDDVAQESPEEVVEDEIEEIDTSPLAVALDKLEKTEDIPLAEVSPERIEQVENPAMEFSEETAVDDTTGGMVSDVETVETDSFAEEPMEPVVYPEVVAESELQEESPESQVPVSPEVVEEVQPIEIRSDIDQYNDFIETGHFEQIPEVYNKLLASGKDSEALLDSFASQVGQHAEDYKYWQCLGDLQARSNKFEDALKNYDKAEEILINSLSKR